MAAVGIATAGAKVLANWVAARAGDEMALNWGFKNELQKLHDRFEQIQASLDDASNSKYANRRERVNLWLEKVKDAAYSADNVMDEYVVEIFRRKMEPKNFMEMVGSFCTPSNPLLFRIQMAHKVKEILSLFNEIDKDAKNIGLCQVDIASTSVAHTDAEDDRQYAAPSASEFVNREDDEEKLLDFICSPNNYEELTRLSTVAIVGMGGLGKTTLTSHLYNHKRICANFGKKIWICVNQKFEIKRLLNEMLESVTSSNLKLSNMDAIIRKLEEELKGKKLLLVLDDVWNDKQDLWRKLEIWLNRIGILPGSVILINTRSDEVVKAARAVFKCELKGLSIEKSWSLLRQIVSNNNVKPISSSMEEVGRRIVIQCKGVPLAIEVMGDLLHSKDLLHEWESIEKSELWASPHGENQIFSSLLLSYNQLPSASIKQCFAYCAMIPKGNLVYKCELIGLWLSQGYLYNDKRKNLTMEEVGEENLNILVSNSLLECVQEVSGFVVYKLHDLAYDLAVYVCGKDLIKEATDLCETSYCRHLRIDFGERNSISDIPPEKALIKLRTLDLKGTLIPWNMMIHVRYLRTLFLDRTGITELDPAVALLKHLRYLDVSYNPISTLPDSFGQLYQLQTLVLRECRNMVKLPKVVSELINLRHISTTTPMFAWRGLQQLTNLQSLPRLSLGDNSEGWTIDELGGLHELRDEIRILGLECVTEDQARKAALARKADITKLHLSWAEGRGETSGGVGDKYVLEYLEPHPNITSLEVQNFIGDRFPTWITRMGVLAEGPRSNPTGLNNLTVVKLLNCSRCQTLPRLGQLPLLKCLILSGLYVEIIGIEFYGGDDLHMTEVVSFKCLIELEISGFRRLTTWREPPKTAFPRLETLRIKDCKMLESVPVLESKSLTTLELADLNSVESLDIIKCSLELTSLTINVLPKIVGLPHELANCSKLQELGIFNMEKLVTLPSGLESMANLQSITVAFCDSLNFVMDDLLQVRSSLHELRILGCPCLKKIPSSVEECTSLETLFCIRTKVENPPTNISKLQRLLELWMSYTSGEHLRSVLESAKNLPLLWLMEIQGFRDDEEIRDYFSDMTPFLRLPSLKTLVLWGHPNVKTLPQQLGLLTRITVLGLGYFDGLEECPDWMNNLSSLVYLTFEFCKNLKDLPPNETLQRLIYLSINDCKLLTKRYAKDVGPDWQNISHINKIIIDDKTIQDI